MQGSRKHFYIIFMIFHNADISHNHQLSWWLEKALEGHDTGKHLKMH